MQFSTQWLKNKYHLAKAVLANLFFLFPGRSLTIIGVTGTDGKTTTATLIYHLLKSAGYKVALISTVAAYIGEEAIDTGFHVTSPDSWSLQRLLRRIVKSGATRVVLEATSHGLDQHRLFGAHIQTAVITNITHEHLDYHLTYERYLAAKAKIFHGVKTAIINADDRSFKPLLKQVPVSATLITYSLNENTASAILTDDSYYQLKSVCLSSFPEFYNQLNALAAAYAALTHGVPLPSILKSLPKFTGVPGRMQFIKNNRQLKLIVDFAHTPNALENALKAAKKITPGQLIVVFGAAGKRDTTKRPLMGQTAAAIADEIILTAEDPRGENVHLINSQIKSGITQKYGHVHSIIDRAEAIKFALSLAKKGDTVIICGKGHEQSMNLTGHQEIPWSDVSVVKQLL